MTLTGREGEKQSAAANQWLCFGDLGDFGLSNEVTVDKSQTRASRQQRLAVGCAVSSTAHMHTKRGTHYIQQLNGLGKMTKRTLTRGSFVSRDRVTFLRRY